MGLETVQPSIVDENTIGGDGDRYGAARSRGDGGAGFGKMVEIIDAPQQRLAAMQDDGKIGEAVFGDVLFNAPQQLLQHLRAHQLGLLVDGGVAKPVTIGAVNVAA